MKETTTMKAQRSRHGCVRTIKEMKTMHDLPFSCPTCGTPLPFRGSHVEPVEAHAPNLDPLDIADIAAHPEFEDWSDEVGYGESLTESLAKSDGFLGPFIVRATLAGHAPIGTEGVVATVLGFHAQNVANARQMLTMGTDGDALVAVDPNMYRALTALLEQLTAEVETFTAELHRSPLADSQPPEVAAPWARQAAQATRRAHNALARRQDLLAEIEASTAERGWQ
jgi:hypothetical protein